jgi:hypothetical protein
VKFQSSFDQGHVVSSCTASLMLRLLSHVALNLRLFKCPPGDTKSVNNRKDISQFLILRGFLSLPYAVF